MKEDNKIVFQFYKYMYMCVWLKRNRSSLTFVLDISKSSEIIYKRCILFWASLVAQTVKHLPTVQETRVRSLGWEDPLEKEMATHSSTLAWKIPWTKEPGGLQSMGSQESDRTEQLHFTSLQTNCGFPLLNLAV